MEIAANDAELYVNRIIAGAIRCEIHDVNGQQNKFLIKNPGRYHKYIAQEIYIESLKLGEEYGLWSEQEMFFWMQDENLWTIEEEGLLKTLPKELEEFKVSMYSAAFDTRQLMVVRAACVKCKNKILELTEKKTKFTFCTKEGYASIEKNKYLVLASLYYLNGTPLLEADTDYMSLPSYISEEAIGHLNSSKLNEGQIRFLSRNDPWRSIWSSRKSEGSVFGVPACDLTDEQRAISIWSAIYDNIYEHPECPPEEVIKDDDVLDGWMIIQRRKREKMSIQNRADSIIANDKIKSSDEVFIPAGSMEAVQQIAQLNDLEADMTKRQRLGALSKKGTLREDQMPDKMIEITRQRNKMFKNK